MKARSPDTVGENIVQLAQRVAEAPPDAAALDGTFDQEARFWGAVTRLLLESGAIPYDLDRQNATPIRDREVLLKLGTRRADPQIEEHWRGRFVEQTLALLEHTGAQRVLELGCGAGWLSLEMARRGIAVDAADLSQERIEIARRYYRERSETEPLGPVDHQVRNLEHFDPPPDRYDAIVSFTTLHHIKNKRRLVEQCYLALPDGGSLIVLDDEHDAGHWTSRGFRSMVVSGLGLLLLAMPSAVPRKRRLLEAVHVLAKGVLPDRFHRRLRSAATPILWRNGESASLLAKGSPFEGVHAHEHISLDDLLSSVFEQVQITRGESFGLRNLLVLDLPQPVHNTLRRVLHTLDQRFAQSAWLPGTVLYAVATKRL